MVFVFHFRLQLRHEASYQFSRPVLPPIKSHKTLKRPFSNQEFVSNKRIDGYNRSYSFEESDNEYNEESSIQCTFNLVEKLCEKKLLPRDKERLDVMRLWSPLGDLEKLFNQMLTQRDNLIKKYIRHFNVLKMSQKLTIFLFFKGLLWFILVSLEIICLKMV